eukprot:7011462-Prymnesium_polylepis.1
MARTPLVRCVPSLRGALNIERANQLGQLDRVVLLARLRLEQQAAEALRKLPEQRGQLVEALSLIHI